MVKKVNPALPSSRTEILTIYIQLFGFLHQDWAIFHVRAVSLVWMLESLTSDHFVESIIAQSMNSPESRIVHNAFEAFGVLWRLTGEFTLCPVRGCAESGYT